MPDDIEDDELFVHPDDEVPFGQKLPGDQKGKWGKVPPHDHTVDQYDCEGCHARFHYVQDLEALFCDEQNRAAREDYDRRLGDWEKAAARADQRGKDRPAIPEPPEVRALDPHDGYSRKLVAYHERHPDCPRAAEDIVPQPVVYQ